MIFKKKFFIYEFIGIWGSGKTTLKNKLYNILTQKGLLVKKDLDYYSYSNISRRLHLILSFLSNPFYLFFFLKIFIVLKPIDKVEMDIFKTLIKITIMKDFLLKKTNPNLLFVEGASHLLPIFKNMQKLQKKDLLYLIFQSNNNSNTFFVFIDLSLEIAYKRVIKDHKNKFYRFSNEELKDLKNKYKYMIINQKKIKNILPKKNIIYLDGKNTVYKNNKYLCNLILNFYK